jgi:hypothetical protein
LPDPMYLASYLKNFLDILEDDGRRKKSKDASAYFEAARSASNDAGPRRTRIDVIKQVLKGKPLE